MAPDSIHRSPLNGVKNSTERGRLHERFGGSSTVFTHIIEKPHTRLRDGLNKGVFTRIG
jgi:hypothetical protein